jgi:hypothetical protein
MNVKSGFKPTAELTKTKEKLKNPQEPRTQAPESQEGLKLDRYSRGGYLWLLGGRLYLKLGWRPSDTYFLGNLSDPLSLAARLRQLIPRPVDVRKAAVQLAKALAAALYVARRCRDSPRWKIRVWEAEAAILDAASTLAWTWPAAHKALRKELKRLGEEAPV